MYCFLYWPAIIRCAHVDGGRYAAVLSSPLWQAADRRAKL